MTTLADRIEPIELMGRYADIADLKDFTRTPWPSTSPRSSACRP
ncbi:hypothetical protein ACIQW4_24230 [Streptomyces albogriseolus]